MAESMIGRAPTKTCQPLQTHTMPTGNITIVSNCINVVRILMSFDAIDGDMIFSTRFSEGHELVLVSHIVKVSSTSSMTQL